MYKICNKCGEKKELKQFYKHKQSKDGHINACMTCSLAYIKEYRKNNEEKIATYYQDNKERIAVYYLNNKEKILANHKEYYDNNREKAAAHRKIYCQDNKEEANAYQNQKYKTDQKYRLNILMSGGIRRSLKLGSKNGKTWQSLVKYGIKDLMNHLESKFKKGMNWNNQGKNGWEIDHIHPISKFDFKTPDDPDFKLCWSLENLQPLWMSENRSKSNKIL